MHSNVSLSLACVLLAAMACSGGTDLEDPPGVDAMVDESCDGCLDGDACLAGTSDDACGAAGLTCTVCSDTQQCQGGACVEVEVPGCGPETCDGCCSGDTCLAGDSAAACGAAGATCLDCGARGVCEQASCEIDPESRWDVVALDAEVPSVNADGNAWDPFGGLPDPFARMLDADDAELAKTGTRSNTPTPVWGQVIAADVRAGDLASFVFEVLDADTDADDTFGRCSLGAVLSYDDFDGTVQVLSCPSETPYTISLVYEPR